MIKAFISPKELKPGQVGFGIYDGLDKCWIGNDEGPQIYVDGVINEKPYTGREMAGIAATVIGKRMMYGWSRLRPVEYKVKANKVKDVIVPTLSVDEALNQSNI